MAQGKPVPIAPKEPLQLLTNYRTHWGILRCAASVLDILRALYPEVATHLAIVVNIIGCCEGLKHMQSVECKLNVCLHLTLHDSYVMCCVSALTCYTLDGLATRCCSKWTSWHGTMQSLRATSHWCCIQTVWTPWVT